MLASPYLIAFVIVVVLTFELETVSAKGIRDPRLSLANRIAALLTERDRYNAAEWLYQRKQYPQAAAAFRELLAAFPTGHYRRQVIERLFDIARDWLSDTWKQVKRVEEFQEKDWIIWLYPYDVYSEVLPAPRALLGGWLRCRNMFYWKNTKPFFNQEGQAVELLRCVYRSEPTGSFADIALFLMGHVAWYREDYQQADDYFSRLIKRLPNSPFAPFALELAIKSKLLIVDDDEKNQAPRLVEARKLTNEALRRLDYSEAKKVQMMRLLSVISAQEAEALFLAAEEAHLAGQMEIACSRYKAVGERYPGTYRATEAKMRLKALRMRRWK